MATTGIKKLASEAKALLSARKAEDIGKLLQLPQYQLELHAAAPEYHAFQIPKRNGGYREVEEPLPELKQALRFLSTGLQAVYYFHKTAAAYGYIPSFKRDVAPRNIYTHAERHMGAPCLLNADLQNFFHAVKQDMVRDIFLSPPFRYAEPLAELLSGLVCHKGRLPMGSPTSPALSNFAATGLDHDLEGLSRQHQITYTRYVDDLSFSANTLPTPEVFHEIETIVRVRGFAFNLEKIKMYNPQETKIITGLCVSEKEISIPESFFMELEQDIQRFAHIHAVATGLGGHLEEPWIQKFIQSIDGRLQFVRFIYGGRHAIYRKWLKRWHAVSVPAEESLVAVWYELP